MLKTTPPTDRVADMLAAIPTVAETLFRHTTKAISVREKANRTAAMGPGIGSDALPAKGEVMALVKKMPGIADEDCDNAEDAKEPRSKIVKSVGGFVKTAVEESAGKISADALHDSTLAPLGRHDSTRQQPNIRSFLEKRS